MGPSLIVNGNIVAGTSYPQGHCYGNITFQFVNKKAGQSWSGCWELKNLKSTSIAVWNNSRSINICWELKKHLNRGLVGQVRSGHLAIMVPMGPPSGLGKGMEGKVRLGHLAIMLLTGPPPG